MESLLVNLFIFTFTFLKFTKNLISKVTKVSVFYLRVFSHHSGSNLFRHIRIIHARGYNPSIRWRQEYNKFFHQHVAFHLCVLRPIHLEHHFGSMFVLTETHENTWH